MKQKSVIFLGVAMFLTTSVTSVSAQDVRGVEVCTVEKQIDRRTSCLQSNIEFLQQTLSKLAHDSQDKMASTDRDLAAARAEITTLKAALDKMNTELAQLKAKPDAGAKK
jgi:septal ring factor EnvC (AmiA/AmiB activator)